MLFCFLIDGFSHADICCVHFIGSFESRGSIYHISEGSVFDFLPQASDVSYDRRTLVHSHSYIYCNAEFFFIHSIEYSDFFLLFECCYAGKF